MLFLFTKYFLLTYPVDQHELIHPMILSGVALNVFKQLFVLFKSRLICLDLRFNPLLIMLQTDFFLLVPGIIRLASLHIRPE